MINIIIIIIIIILLLLLIIIIIIIIIIFIIIIIIIIHCYYYYGIIPLVYCWLDIISSLLLLHFGRIIIIFVEYRVLLSETIIISTCSNSRSSST